jgi:uncharacterized metal-binding protein YceD (DUF177 family)
MVKAKPVSEFDVSVAVDRIGDEAYVIEAEADEASRQAVAQRFDIPGVESLSVSARLQKISKGRYIRVKGQVRADVILRCVVTLEEFPFAVDEELDLRFATSPDVVKGREVLPHEELELAEAEELLPDLVEDGEINVGELAVEAVSIALPDFPRLPDAALPEGAVTEEDGAVIENLDSYRPFAKLAALKDKNGD